jgi:hypothetical protein
VERKRIYITESYKVLNRDTIQVIPLLNTNKTPWEERQRIIFMREVSWANNLLFVSKNDKKVSPLVTQSSNRKYKKQGSGE